MARIFKVKIATGSEKVIQVVAETEEEARTKATATITSPDEVITTVEDQGEVLV